MSVHDETFKTLRTITPLTDAQARDLSWHGERAIELMTDGRISKMGIYYAYDLTKRQLMAETPKLTSNELRSVLNAPSGHVVYGTANKFRVETQKQIPGGN